MSGWSDLAGLGVTVRPIQEPRPPQGGRTSPFKATLSNTVGLLFTELYALDAENVVLELDLRDRDIRVDGLPRADARPNHPAVALSFDSKHGPLRYATAEYDAGNVWVGGSYRQIPAWQANLRAIALSMQALRAVDRYGVSKRGEQYTGWRAIPASTDPADAIQTRLQAIEFMAQWHGDWKQAVRETHPDHGGNETTFRQVMRAKELLA